MPPETDELTVITHNVIFGPIAARATPVLLGAVTVEVRDFLEAAVGLIAPLVTVPGFQYITQTVSCISVSEVVDNLTHLHPDGEA